MTNETPTVDFETWAHERARHFEWFAESTMPQPGREPKRLTGAMRYAVLGGGKRIRPLLCYAAGQVTGADPKLLDRAALALELIHGYSLVHDDMPAMDNDTLRRGRPTVHVQYGEATAMLAGDALQSEAFNVLAQAKAPAERVVMLVGTLARAAGVWGMCGGQALDLAMVGGHPGEAELFRMQSMKTGALILASVLMGAQSGEWNRLGDAARGGLAAYAQALGLAFQVVDDILDCTQDTATLGKTAGKDEKDDKPTWVSILGLEGAKARAKSLHDEALAALDMVAADPAVPEKAVARLTEIAHYVVGRSF
ncbi:polyprenyl synthetase family protein [Sutterella parvirubra]|uniref:Polyprenyl synthetase n=1 Tax=Sutterella parvirubra YIT 11816 TaxID=762967 RepID=H3KHT3_9BURK|nr:polyprenyl synthetase [Sutterella parvirubra YIT 11816]